MQPSDAQADTQADTLVEVDPAEVIDKLKTIAARWAEDRATRQRRRELVKEDFDELRDAGYLLCAVPEDQGGLWRDVRHSTRPVCEMLRTLAHGDASVALVASMHPAVTMPWLTAKVAPEPNTEAWEAQRQWVFQTARDGHWWGTIISEPGSGGDVSKTKAIARRRAPGQYLLSGQKHFGTGSGQTSFMITTAVPDMETEPETFIMDMRGVPWDGSEGVKLIAPWDGHGMTATQSHGMSFEDFPAARLAWSGRAARESAGPPRPAGQLFTAVVVGIVEEAIETARGQLVRKRNSMKAYERTEWANVEIEGWLIQKAYQGALRDTEEDRAPARSALLCKEAVAKLAESVMLRIAKVVGGAAYSRHSPYGFWLEDVRALGFLRPPWGFAYDRIFDELTEAPE